MKEVISQIDRDPYTQVEKEIIYLVDSNVRWNVDENTWSSIEDDSVIQRIPNIIIGMTIRGRV